MNFENVSRETASKSYTQQFPTGWTDFEAAPFIDKKSLTGMLDLSGEPDSWQKDAAQEGYFHQHQHRYNILTAFVRFGNRQKTAVYMTSVRF
ncbi:MAG: hypothetical protein DDG60_14525 [Anaerolineae bacterium]|nr:MAG: hypothetical protein DDG60_14525 [Anaerolineae bacterium]